MWLGAFLMLYSEPADTEIKHYNLSGSKALSICKLFKHFWIHFKPHEKPTCLNL